MESNILAVQASEHAMRFQSFAYIAAAILFILSLAGLSKQTTASRGNTLGIVGMGLALAATVWVSVGGDSVGIVNEPDQTFVLIAAAVAAGAALGVRRARKVEMAGMPELIALLHSFVGLAAVLVGYGSYLVHYDSRILFGESIPDTSRSAFHLAEVGLAVFVGAITLTGSVVAYLKLSGRITGVPLTLPGRKWLNLAAVAISLLLILWLVHVQTAAMGFVPLLLLTVVALALGAHVVLAIGAGDMPVAISMLNSYSGWAAAMAGFALENDLLIITGALVGSSGAYLSYIMCRAMNRSLASVILGGLGPGARTETDANRDDGEYHEIDAPELAQMLRNSTSVVIVPGYGMAVAQAQYPVADMARRLRDMGIDVRFGIHPVAGRLPGHMNVLLAEAKVPYDIVFEMDEINEAFPSTDVVLVLGANDTVNPAAQKPGSPIAGMPVLRVWEARNVIVFKRSMGTSGYSGVHNPLLLASNAQMFLGDARESIEDVVANL